MAVSRPDSWAIIVVRTGGFAGLRREWRTGTADAPDVDWATLIGACPWKDAVKPADPRARDQFVWRLEASGRARAYRATLSDGQLTGAWRSLVDEVRRARRGDEHPRPATRD
ncbi:protealysin inhibitor emfourin [Conyzicola sp.]|uniref:protealysin inhibitor emfourin n=1 Tax=Conyzicola sp. TaxID=1969404 RepID=UPI003988CDA5